jgi:hypothetical protein
MSESCLGHTGRWRLTTHTVSVLFQDDATDFPEIGIHLDAMRIRRRVKTGEQGQLRLVASLGLRVSPRTCEFRPSQCRSSGAAVSESPR